jgi:hypothetical protein
VELLLQAFFPSPEQARLDDIRSTNTPQKPYKEITIEDLVAAAKKLANDKAPGPDQLPNRCIKATLPVLAPYLLPLFQKCLAIGYHPQSFKDFSTIALKKGGDNRDFRKLNSWRLIALLSSLGKLLELIVAEKLVELTEEYNLLPPN